MLPSSKSASPTQQQGLATLTVSLIVLLLMSLIVFRTSSTILYEIKTSNNQYYQTQALEAANGGVEYALAWLASGSNTSSLAWNNDTTGPSPNTQQATSTTFPTTVTSQTIGGYSVSVSLWRNNTTPAILELRSTATGSGSATVRQKILLGTTSTSTPNTLNLNSFAPIVINGGMSNIKGNPSVTPGQGNVAIVTSSSQSSNQMQTGHLNLNGGIVSYGAFTGSAWGYVFGNVTQTQMAALAAQQAAADQLNGTNNQTIFYYNASNPPPQNWHTSLGTSTNPVALIFDTGAGCPKMNGGVVIYGVVYYADDCGKNGWGGATIYGSLVAEQSITQLTANTQFYGWSNSSTGIINLPPTTTTTNTFAKKPAGWRDF